MELQWKIPGIFNADANLVAAEIESIGEEATAEQILELARDANTELHKCFVWDDTKAAELWRLHTARQVAGSITIKRVERDEDIPQVRYFMRGDNTAYKPIKTIIQRPDEYNAMLARALNELQAFKRKYEILSNNELMRKIMALIP